MDQVRPLISIINGHYPYLSESIKLNGFRQYHIHSNHCRLNSMDSDISVSIMYMVIPCILNQPDSDSSYKITRLIKEIQPDSISHSRDYFDEIEAILKVEPAGWTVKRLCLWSDLVEKPSVAAALKEVDEKTVEDREEELENANFAALKAKIATLNQFVCF